MANTTTTIKSQFVNNSTAATSVNVTVPQVVVGNNLVPDFRQSNPGVINGLNGTPIATDGTVPYPSVFSLS